MKIFRITTAFFYLGLFFFSSQLIAQSNKRIKLLDAVYVLINGDSIEINSLDKEWQKEINERITSTCKRNIQVALTSQKKQPAKAYYFIKNTLLLDSTFLPAHAVLVRLYLNKKDTVQALNKALKAYEVTKSKKFLPIITALEKGKDNADLDNVDIEDIAASAKVNYVRGLNHYYEGSIDSALINFQQIPKDSYNLLGATTIKLLYQNNDEGRKDMISFLSDSLFNNIAAYQLAVSSYKKNDLATSLKYLEDAIGTNSMLLAGYYMRAHVFHELGQITDAIKDFEVCLNHQYRYKESINNLAVCNYELAMFEEAEKVASKAINENYATAMTYLVRGNSKEMINKFSEACEDWYKAVDLGMTDILPKIENFCNRHGNTK